MVTLMVSEQRVEVRIGGRCHPSSKIKLPPHVYESPLFDIS
jgi:hypothetical protein